MDFLTQAFIRIRGRRTPEDALQEAFVRLWKNKYRPRDEGEAVALLSRTARNITIDEYRKARRRQTESIEGRQLVQEEDDSRAREMLFRRVEASIETELSELQRTIVKRHEYEGETFEEIAKDLGMQPAAVRMQVSRARKALREKFRKDDEER